MRYGASALAGDRGYTGQRTDSTPGLTYFNARYYDQDVGAFVSADTYDAGGLNRYAYVGGDPETRTDPTGHRPDYLGSFDTYIVNPSSAISAIAAVGVLAGQLKAAVLLREAQPALAHALNFQANKAYYQMRDAGDSPEALIDFALQNYRAGNVTNAILKGGKAARNADAAASLAEDGGHLLRAAKWLGYAGLVIGGAVDFKSSEDAWLQAHPGDTTGAFEFGAAHAVASTVGSVVGASAGAFVGTAAGAAIGSVIPVVGTVIGGYVGGFIGSAVGGYIGGAVGDALVDWAVGPSINNAVTSVSSSVSSAASAVSGWFSSLW